MLGPILSVCLMEQHCVTASNRELFSPLLLFTSSCRLAKEEISYKNEAKQQEEKVERLKAEAGDEYVLKKQVCASCVFASFILKQS